MVVRSAIAYLVLFSVSGCVSAPMNGGAAVLRLGQYNEVGACIVDKLTEINGTAYPPERINYKEMSAPQRSEVVVPVTGPFGPQDVAIGFYIQQVDATHVSIRTEGIQSINNTFEKIADEALAACSG